MVAVADVNSDGLPDLVTSDEGGTSIASSTVSVLLNQGHRVFGSPMSFTTARPGFSSKPSSVAVADVDSDGHADLIVTTIFNRGVAVLFGIGDGRFGSPVTHPVPNADCLALADFNEDGAVDIVAGHASDPHFSVLLNAEGGMFRSPLDEETPGFVVAVAAGDLDGDGHVDVAAVSGSREYLEMRYVSIFRGRGDGSFEHPAVAYEVAPGPAWISLGDWSGDGNLDLATASPRSGLVTLLENRGDGSFGVRDLNVGPVPRSITIADVDRDGRLDLVVSHDFSVGGNSVTVSLGAGAGSFSAPITHSSALSTGPGAVADVDADGWPDLLFTHGKTLESMAPGLVGIFYGNEDGTHGRENQVPVGQIPSGIAAGDLNGDGLPDIVVGSGRDEAIDVLLNAGHGRFQSRASYAAGKLSDVAIGSADSDGFPDVFGMMSYPTAGIAILRGDGFGGFGPPLAIPLSQSGDCFGVGDLDHDGISDVVFSCSPQGQGRVVVLRGVGDGFFQVKSVQFSVRMSQLSIMDLDGDGDRDLVFASELGVQAWLGNGDGDFLSSVDLTPREIVVRFSLADVDGDNDLDVLYCLNTGVVRMALGRAGGGFSPPVSLGMTEFARSCALVDLSGDGAADIAILDGSWSVRVQVGNGRGEFSGGVRSGAGAWTTGMAVADLDRDGFMDIVALNQWEVPTVTVLMNRGDPISTPVQTGASIVSAAASFEHVEIVWYWAGEGLPSVQRARGGGWSPLRTAEPTGPGLFSVVDRDIIAGGRYGYRLVVQDQEGGETAVGETWIDVPEAPALWVSCPVSPIAGAPVVLRVHVASEEPSSLRLFDVGGRSVWSTHWHPARAGSSEVTVERSALLKSGVYWVELRQARNTARGRVVVAR